MRGEPKTGTLKLNGNKLTLRMDDMANLEERALGKSPASPHAFDVLVRGGRADDWTKLQARREQKLYEHMSATGADALIQKTLAPKIMGAALLKRFAPATVLRELYEDAFKAANAVWGGADSPLAKRGAPPSGPEDLLSEIGKYIETGFIRSGPVSDAGFKSVLLVLPVG